MSIIEKSALAHAEGQLSELPVGATQTAKPARRKKPPRKPFPNKVQNVVWGRSAGRCQYAGCIKPLIGEQISGARHANKSYIAHIVGDSPDGPQGDATLSLRLAHDPDNLMLVCDEQHPVIDREMIDTHSVEVLREMKQRHEDRIRGPKCGYLFEVILPANDNFY